MSDETKVDLGAFSISLNVKDLSVSKDFYEKLGFKKFGGDDEYYLIMKNGQHMIGLFQGMFDKNILTFNPGWNQDAEELDTFTDVRKLQEKLKDARVKLVEEADTSTEGPASFTLLDPDGNPILIDQHV